MLAKHDREWSREELAAAADKSAMFTWGASGPMGAGAIDIVKSDGCYFWDGNGKKYLDFNSQAMCLHHGHTPHPSIVEAVTEQLQTAPYAYPGMTMVPVRAKLCSLLADIVPGPINTFMFPSSGAEANEAGMRFVSTPGFRQSDSLANGLLCPTRLSFTPGEARSSRSIDRITEARMQR